MKMVRAYDKLREALRKPGVYGGFPARHRAATGQSSRVRRGLESPAAIMNPSVAVGIEGKFQQDRPGRPGTNTRYNVRKVRRNYTLHWQLDERSIEYDKVSDGTISPCSPMTGASLPVTFSRRTSPTYSDRCCAS